MPTNSRFHMQKNTQHLQTDAKKTMTMVRLQTDKTRKAIRSSSRLHTDDNKMQLHSSIVDTNQLLADALMLQSRSIDCVNVFSKGCDYSKARNHKKIIRNTRPIGGRESWD